MNDNAIFPSPESALSKALNAVQQIDESCYELSAYQNGHRIADLLPEFSPSLSRVSG